MRIIDAILNPWRRFREQHAIHREAMGETRTRRRADGARRTARRRQATLARLWAATNGPFVVADLETTGLSAERAEILEVAAVRVDARGKIVARFQALVRTRGPVPAAITRLTGLTTHDTRTRGRPLAEVLPAFLAFAGPLPILCHNAAFDRRFLARAADRLGLALVNPVFCTLTMARALWPTLPSHRLAALARHVGAPAPTHRGLDDVLTTLAVLRAARAVALASTLEEARAA